MKRRALLKALHQIAKEHRVSIVHTEGRRHTHVTINGQLITVPRHREVAEATARAILKMAREEASR